MRVLIADDDHGARMSLATAVEQLGHECAEAGDGPEALRRHSELAPDVVIAGADLPGLSGTELAARIRAVADVPYAYVMVLTDQPDDAAARAAIAAGADDVAVKPLEAAELERRLVAAQRMTVVLRHSRQDPLTGVGNRLRLAEDIAALCGRVARYGHAYCVALLEVDGFQSLGREAGDDVLRRVAEALSATIRSGDTLYRYGGEQFLVLLPEQGLDGAALAGERLRAAIEVLAVEHPEAGTVTVSAGVAGLGSVSCSPEELFELAGRALGRAKEAGGNRVEVEEAGEPDRGDRAVRLLIAGEDETARSALTALAQRDAALDLVGAAAGAEQAVQLAGQRRPDVVLLDFDMPAGAGVRAAIDIREALPGVRIVAISADDSQAAQLDMSRAGAVGFLLKGAADDDEIVRVIRSAFRY